MSEIDQELLNCFCDEASDLLVKWEGICIKMEKASDEEKKPIFDELFRAAHNLKGSSRAVGLDAFGDFVHKIEDGISLLKSGESKATPDVIAALFSAQSMLLEWITSYKSGQEFSKDYKAFIVEYSAKFKGEKTTTKTEPQAPKVEAISESAPKDDHKVEQPKVVATPKQATQEKTTKQAQPKSNPDETVRVAARKLDQILEMVGELSIHQSVIWHSRQLFEGKNALVSHSAYLARKLTRELYEKALSLRMYPVQPVFQRLDRNIRDIARSLNKEVEVEVLGGEVELDKTVCEKIVEPLTHMVRNSVDHGIEKPEDRKAAGKNPHGKVRLIATQETGAVLLIIEDDGKGLNEERILKKALENGIIQADTKLSKQEIYALIFLPGFSTAEKVTDVSGRGVGMDVVMRTIEELQGKVTIASEAGKGTRFTISLPTTLSIIDALIISMDGLDYAVPVSAVDEIVDLEEYNIQTNDQMFKLRDKVIPLQNISDYLTVGNKSQSAKTECKSALVAKVGKQKVAFRVQRVIDQQQIVVRPLNDGMANVFGFSGSTILADGQPGLIIDLATILKTYIKNVQPQEKTA